MNLYISFLKWRSYTSGWNKPHRVTADINLRRSNVKLDPGDSVITLTSEKEARVWDADRCLWGEDYELATWELNIRFSVAFEQIDGKILWSLQNSKNLVNVIYPLQSE